MKIKEAQAMAERINEDRKTLIGYLRHDISERELNRAAEEAGFPRFGVKLAYYVSDISTAMLMKVISCL